jgi:transposase
MMPRKPGERVKTNHRDARKLAELGRADQHRPGVGRGLNARRTGRPTQVIAIANKAQQRLCRRSRRLLAEHKPAPKVAVARELAGFIRAALQTASG